MLPKVFYAKINSFCSTFLWKNSTSSARGTRVAWNDIWKPKVEGGLGIRSLEAFAEVFRRRKCGIYSQGKSICWLHGVIIMCLGKELLVNGDFI